MEELSKMEKVLARFSGLGKKIFNQLDNQNFCKCNWVSRSLRKCIEENEPLWTRVIKKYNANQEKFKDAWKLVLKKIPVQNVEDLAIIVEQFLSFIDDHEQSFVMRRKEHPSKYIASFCSLRIKRQPSPHYIAAECGCLSLCKFIALQKEMLNPTKSDKLILHLAVQEGHFDVCQHFINNLDIRPIHETAQTAVADALGEIKYVAKGLQHFNTRRPNHGLTPLHVAAGSRAAASLLQLLASACPAACEVQDVEGKTPLHFAAANGHDELCAYIMDLVLDINPGDISGDTPLHSAAQTGNCISYQVIFEKVLDRNPKNNAGNTPLHMAAWHGHSELFELAVLNAQDINPGNHIGKTPLHFAAKNGHIEVCEFILDFVVDMNPRSNDGHTPLSLAASHGHFEICRLFWKKGYSYWFSYFLNV